LQYKALDMLGNSYRDGLGVPQNYIEAYKWYFLAGVRGHPDAATQMQAVAHFMSEDQISEARNAAKAFADRDKTHPDVRIGGSVSSGIARRANDCSVRSDPNGLTVI
jgi:TPR repeat protein